MNPLTELTAITIDVEHQGGSVKASVREHPKIWGAKSQRPAAVGSLLITAATHGFGLPAGFREKDEQDLGRAAFNGEVPGVTVCVLDRTGKT